jgi:hypothetical protein
VDNVDQFVATLLGVLDRVGTEGALFSKVEARRQQEVVRFLRWDRVNWWRWLTGIAVEHDCDLATIVARYRGRQSHRFPVAVVLLV